MNIEYPKKIVLKEGEKLDFLRQHSQVIHTLYDNQGNQGPLELTADLLFPLNDDVLQKEKWELFFDLFFPEKAAGRLFKVSGNTVRVNESRGGKEALREMLDYLMVDKPDTMMNFAKGQALKQINAPAAFLTTVPRAKGKNNYRLSAANNRSYYNFNNMNNNNYNNNNNNNNNSNISIGYTEEEESALGKLSGTAAKKYYPKQRRTRRNRKARKTRKANRK